MRHHEEVPAHVEKRWEITKVQCDMCGKLCPDPKDENWSEDAGHRSHAGLYLRMYYDGDEITHEVDLCEECADWLIDAIRLGNLKRGVPHA